RGWKAKRIDFAQASKNAPAGYLGPFSTAQTTQSATEPKAPDTTRCAQNQFKMPQEVKQKNKPRRDGVGRDCRKPFDGSLVPKINDAFGVSRRRMANGTKAHRMGRLPSRVELLVNLVYDMINIHSSYRNHT
uniref:Uncharacterized protein n=1 Tax=Anopheles melas TaxID=34690 RepID=A0A182TPS3_9DIPT